MNKFALFSCLSLLTVAAVAESTDPIRIGSNTYPTLQAAFVAAKDGDTIEILADINEAGTATDKFYNLEADRFRDKGLTIDAGSCTITIGFSENAGCPMIVLFGNNKMTINGGIWKVSADSRYNQSGKVFYLSGSGSSAVLNNVTVDNTATAHAEDPAIDAAQYSTVALNRTTVMTSGGTALSVGDNSKDGGVRAGHVIVANSAIQGDIALLTADLLVTGAETQVSGSLTASKEYLIAGSTIRKGGSVVLAPLAGCEWSSPDADGIQTMREIVANREIEIGSVGVTAIMSSLKNTIVAVSFADLEEGGAIKVADLVKTDNLTEGDQLAIFNGGQTYDTWTLQGGAWVKNDKTFTQGFDGLLEGTGTAADEATKVVGTGFWLVRNNDYTEGTQFTFYTYGKPVVAPVSAITKKTVALIGNPKQAAVELTTDKVEGAVAGDRIQIPQVGGFKIYTRGASGWSTFDAATKQFVVTSPSIPAGTGFWYISNGDSDVSIQW